MELFDSPEDAAEWCAARRGRGAQGAQDERTLGFVPTMGALHAGHDALVARSVRENAASCVSVFVNPLQFDDPRDFERYPRDLETDARRLAELGVDMAFTGTLETFFPSAIGPDGRLSPALRVAPGPGALGLEGALRPGHFEGVATIVDRLFSIVEPTRAYFGQKDWQQTVVVRELARRRGGPELVVCETVRAADGLALSSRNALLDPRARRDALALPRALEAAASAWERGAREAAELARAMRAVLEASPLEIDYAEARDAKRWSPEPPAEPLRTAVCLVAARAGGVRLIDNRLLGTEAA